VRLFVAIQISEEPRRALAEVISHLTALAPRVKWVRAKNLHVTLKFLGNTDPAKLQPLENALSIIRSNGFVTLNFQGLSFFPNEKRPRVFWAGMEATPNLKTIAAGVDQAVHNLGFPLDERPFTPHLTLARFDPPGIAPKLSAAIAENASRSFGSTTTNQFHLIESRVKPNGAEYTTLRSFPFVAES
jgi:RNA 2',3'-cyclic 3'-phosphodiesterase